MGSESRAITYEGLTVTNFYKWITHQSEGLQLTLHSRTVSVLCFSEVISLFLAQISMSGALKVQIAFCFIHLGISRAAQ